MKPLNLWRFYQKHPLSLTFYLFYILILGRLLWVQLQFEAAITATAGEKLSWGEGIMYGYFFITMIAFIFIMVTIINAVVNKARKRFYLQFLACIIIPLIVLWVVPLL